MIVVNSVTSKGIQYSITLAFEKRNSGVSCIIFPTDFPSFFYLFVIHPSWFGLIFIILTFPKILMTINDNRWQSMVIDDNQWQSMVIDDNRWQSIPINFLAIDWSLISDINGLIVIDYHRLALIVIDHELIFIDWSGRVMKNEIFLYFNTLN